MHIILAVWCQLYSTNYHLICKLSGLVKSFQHVSLLDICITILAVLVPATSIVTWSTTSTSTVTVATTDFMCSILIPLGSVPYRVSV